MKSRDRVFVSYATPDVQIAQRIVDCLEDSHRGMIWFDRNEIVWGDNVIQEINEGLSNSLMGIVILSDNFFHRNMPRLELNTMILLMNTVQFRILPLYHEITHQELLTKYPLLGSIRGESADEDCETLVSMFDRALQKTRQITDIFTEEQLPVLPESNVSSDTGIVDADPSELRNIYDELTRGTGTNRRDVVITTFRHYSETRRIWKHNVTWDIISNLINSKSNSDIKDGLYVLEFIIRTSAKDNRVYAQVNIVRTDVKDLIRERFGSYLILLTYPNVDRRISFDSFNILKEITGEEILSKYALNAVRIAIKVIESDNEYTHYIQVFVAYFEAVSNKTKKLLCDAMYELTSTDDRMGNRAKELYEYFIKLT